MLFCSYLSICVLDDRLQLSIRMLDVHLQLTIHLQLSIRMMDVDLQLSIYLHAGCSSDWRTAFFCK